jgi:cobalt-zinc-cadmium efflux system outer membrane protein
MMTRGLPSPRRAAATRVSIAAWIVLLVGATPALRAQAPAGLSLEDVLARAMSANPTIIAARLQRPVDLYGVDVAKEHPNPDLSYEGAKDTPKQSIGISVPIELGGKRNARIALAEATVAVDDAELARVIADVRSDVRRAYFEVVAADRQIAIADDVRTLAMRARDAAQARVAAGDAPRSDQTQAELGLQNAENQLTAARGEGQATREELNALMGQPAGTPVVLSDGLTTAALPSLSDAVGRARQTNAQLQALDRRITAQMAKRSVADTLRRPDMTAGGAFTFDAQPDFDYGWRVNFGVTLPIFTSHRAGVFVEDAELARLKAERDALSARMEGAIAAALARAAAARDAITRYETVIVPLEADAEQMAQDSYTAGQTGSSALIQALQTARETRQQGLQASLDYQRALADLDQAIGASIK